MPATPETHPDYSETSWELAKKYANYSWELLKEYAEKSWSFFVKVFDRTYQETFENISLLPQSRATSIIRTPRATFDGGKYSELQRRGTHNSDIQYEEDDECASSPGIILPRKSLKAYAFEALYALGVGLLFLISLPLKIPEFILCFIDRAVTRLFQKALRQALPSAESKPKTWQKTAIVLVCLLAFPHIALKIASVALRLILSPEKMWEKADAWDNKYHHSGPLLGRLARLATFVLILGTCLAFPLVSPYLASIHAPTILTGIVTAGKFITGGAASAYGAVATMGIVISSVVTGAFLLKNTLKAGVTKFFSSLFLGKKSLAIEPPQEDLPPPRENSNEFFENNSKRQSFSENTHTLYTADTATLGFDANAAPPPEIEAIIIPSVKIQPASNNNQRRVASVRFSDNTGSTKKPTEIELTALSGKHNDTSERNDDRFYRSFSGSWSF